MDQKISIKTSPPVEEKSSDSQKRSNHHHSSHHSPSREKSSSNRKHTGTHSGHKHTSREHSSHKHSTTSRGSHSVRHRNHKERENDLIDLSLYKKVGIEDTFQIKKKYSDSSVRYSDSKTVPAIKLGLLSPDNDEHQMDPNSPQVRRTNSNYVIPKPLVGKKTPLSSNMNKPKVQFNREIPDEPDFSREPSPKHKKKSSFEVEPHVRRTKSAYVIQKRDTKQSRKSVHKFEGCSGFMRKRNKMKRWQKRWFVLDESGLSWYSKKTSESASETVDVTGCSMDMTKIGDFSFILMTENRAIHLDCFAEEDRIRWNKALKSFS